MEKLINIEYIKKHHLIQAAIILACLILPLFLITQFYIVPFALLAGALVVLITISRPFIGLLLYSVFVFIRPQEFIQALEFAPIPVERTMAALLILSMLLKLKGKIFKVQMPAFNFSLLAFLLISLLSLVTSIWVSNSWTRWQEILRLYIIFFLVVRLIDSKTQLKYFIIFIIFSSAFHAFASIYNYMHGTFTSNVAMGIDRAVGIDQSLAGPNSLAATMVYTLPFIYYYYQADKAKWVKSFLIAVTALLLLCVILTGSRQGMLGIVFFVMLVLWQNKHKMRGLAFAVILLGAVWLYMPAQYQERFTSISDLSSESASAASARGRIQGLVTGLKMILDRPLLGYGIGNFGAASGMIYNPSDYHDAHNLLGQILGELGLLGTASFAIWVLLMFKYLNKIIKIHKTRDDKFYYYTAIGLKLQLLCLLFFGLTGHNLYRYNWYIIAALMLVMIKPLLSEPSGGNSGESVKTETAKIQATNS